jgi:hypothetical protein
MEGTEQPHTDKYKIADDWQYGASCYACVISGLGF